jgi:membrane protein
MSQISWARPRVFWGLLLQAGQAWSEHKAQVYGAALAYYSVFSIAPLLLIAIAVAGLVFGKEAAQGKVAEQIEYQVGRQSAQAIEVMISNASWPSSGSGYTAAVVGFILVIFGAMGLFLQIQDSMNTVWEVKPTPGRGWLGLIRERLLSFALVMVTVLLVLASLVISSALAALESLFGPWFSSRMAQTNELLLSSAIATLLFAMIYRFVPEAKVAWKDVWLGALITAVLFAVGKTLMAIYLRRSTITSAYGAAGSLVALMIWAYYSAQIFLFGAEFTQVFAKRFGSWSRPESDAVPTSTVHSS